VKVVCTANDIPINPLNQGANYICTLV